MSEAVRFGGSPDGPGAACSRPAELLAGRKVGLVLGAGGARGAAYHAGAVLALWSDARWDPRDAEIVVGTSAGAIVGALLRTGIPPDDLAALVVGADLRQAPPELADRWVGAGDGLPSWWTSLRGPLRVRRPATVAAGVRRLIDRGDPWPLMASIGARGSFDLESAVPVLEGPWPERGVWICAVDEGSLERVVFGRDRQATLSAAVQASCAVPTIMQPVDVEGRPYIDGGLHSATNADLLIDAGVETAVVLSPMTGTIPRLHPVGALMRTAQRHLDAEVEALTGAGIEVVVVQPDESTRSVMGVDLLDGSMQKEVLQASYFSTGSFLMGAPSSGGRGRAVNGAELSGPPADARQPEPRRALPERSRRGGVTPSRR